MKQAILLIVAIFSIFLISNVVLAAGDGSITIESPKKDEMVKGPDVTVKFKFVKEGIADHLHYEVDGEGKGPVNPDSTKKGELVVKGLKKGEHELKLVAATKDHKYLKVESSVKIKVE